MAGVTRHALFAWPLVLAFASCTPPPGSISLPQPEGAESFVLAIGAEENELRELVVERYADWGARALAIEPDARLTLAAYGASLEALGLPRGVWAAMPPRVSCRVLAPLAVLDRGGGDADWTATDGDGLLKAILPDPATCAECLSFAEQRVSIDTSQSGSRQVASAAWLTSGAAWVGLLGRAGVWRVTREASRELEGCRDPDLATALPLGANRYIVGAAGGWVARMTLDEAAHRCAFEQTLRRPDGLAVHHLVGSPDASELFVMTATARIERYDGAAFVDVGEAPFDRTILEAKPRGVDDGGLVWVGPGELVGASYANRAFTFAVGGSIESVPIPVSPPEAHVVALRDAGELGIVVATEFAQLFRHGRDRAGPWTEIPLSPIQLNATALGAIGPNLFAYGRGVLQQWSELTGWCEPHRLMGDNSTARELLVDPATRTVFIADAIFSGNSLELVWLTAE